jgi:hypothetical protein
MDWSQKEGLKRIKEGWKRAKEEKEAKGASTPKKGPAVQFTATWGQGPPDTSYSGPSG